MILGKIIDLAQGDSRFIKIRDQYGNDYSVGREDISDDAREGDQAAYRVEFSSNIGSPLTLKSIE